MQGKSTKRQKELARAQKQQEKENKRQERKREKENRPSQSGAEDPDIAGIIPGPQPPLEF